MSRVAFTEDDGAERGAADDPYDEPGLVEALAAGPPATARRAHVRVGDGGVSLLTVWQPVGSRYLVRSPDYGAIALRGSLSAADLRAARTALNAALVDEGAASHVSLIGPFCTHRRGSSDAPQVLDEARRCELAAAWQTAPCKPVATVGWNGSGPDLAALPGKVRNDVRAGLRHERRCVRFTRAEAAAFAEEYGALMEDKQAADRWRLDADFFAALVDRTAVQVELWLTTIHGEGGSARALFARSGRRAVYLFACRRGTVRGAPGAALWTSFEHLHTLGVREVLLGGGVSGEPGDSLWRFKEGFADRVHPLYLGAHLFDEHAHDRAVDLGLARPLPSPCTPAGAGELARTA